MFLLSSSLAHSMRHNLSGEVKSKKLVEFVAEKTSFTVQNGCLTQPSHTRFPVILLSPLLLAHARVYYEESVGLKLKKMFVFLIYTMMFLSRSSLKVTRSSSLAPSLRHTSTLALPDTNHTSSLHHSNTQIPAHPPANPHI